MGAIGYVLMFAAAGVAVPIAVLCVECFAALWPGRAVARTPQFTGRVDVLIPAHNEELVLESTLQRLQRELRPGDRIWVIADNSSDATAAIARCGAHVLERHDAQLRGKGYALDFALRHLADDHGDVIVVLDADCQLSPGSLDRIAALAHASGRPVQAGYSMFAAGTDCRGDGVSQLAVLVKNVVRPLGLTKLGLPCLLTGSGMAFPWEVIQGARLASGNIVEDMQLSVDLLLASQQPVFCAEAGVAAVLPAEQQARVSQRTRWEHGHLQTILSQTPRLLRGAIVQRRLGLLASALDIAVPPLSLLLLAWVTTTIATLAFALWWGSWLPAATSMASGTLLLVAMLAVTYAFSPGGWSTIAAVPGYVAAKLPIYASFLLRRQTAWVRTSRQVEAAPVGNPTASA